MSTHNINITGNSTNSTPPTANPINLSFQKSDSDNVHFKNNTAFSVTITFNDANAFSSQQLQLSPNSGLSVSVNETCEDGEYYYDIHYDGMPGPAIKPFIYLSSTPIVGGNPAGGPTGAVEH